MAKTPEPLVISGANFRSIHEKLDDGFGLFVDGSVTYVVLDAKTHAVDVLRRQDKRNWTDVMTGQPSSVRVSINGQIFGPSNMYQLALTGTVSPDAVDGHGSIRETGRTVAENAEEGKTRYFFGRSKDGTRYRCGIGNPPDDIYEGMGGLGPLIITNPVTGVGVRAGVGNQYASDPGKTNIPESDDEWRDCTQRNSSHFQEIEKGNEFCLVASHSSARLLLFAIETDDSAGRITTVRDKLVDAGFDCAAFTDGSNSSCITVDSDVLVKPHIIKDRLIEAGFKGVKGSKPVKLRIAIKSLEVVDPAPAEGDEGTWTMSASINGTEVGAWTRARVIAGDTLDLGWELELETSSSTPLSLRFAVDNVAGAAVTGVDPPEISDYEDNFGADSDPPFSEGAWVIENRDGFYKLHYAIEVL